jgi:hypothetical protein
MFKPSGPSECINKGYPSQDNRIRLYSNKECDSLNGNFYPNGECLKKTGGSFSWECRYLNRPDSEVCKIMFY